MSQSNKSRWGFLKGNLGVMLLSSGLWTLAGQMTGPFFSLYVLGLGGNYVDIGLISAMGAIVRIAPTFIGGYLTDTIGRKRIVFSMSFLLAVNELINVFAPTYQLLFLSAALGALWGGIREPAFSSLIADSTKPENRAMGYALWNVVPPIFGVVSPYVIGIFMDRYGTVVALRWAYLFVFCMGILASLIRWRFLKETLAPEDMERVELRKVIGEMLEGFRITFRSLPRGLWVFLVIDIIISLGWSLIDPYFVTFAKEVAGLSSAQWGLTVMVWTLTNIVIRIPSAFLSDRYGRLNFIRPTLLLYPLTILFFLNSKGFTAVLLVRLSIAVLLSIDGPAWQALHTDYSPREHRGRFYAVASVIRFLFWSTGNIVGGFLYQEVSKKTPFQVGSVFLFVGAVAFLFFVREPKTREE